MRTPWSVARLLLALTISVSAAVSMGATWRGGAYGAANPAYLVPASADLYAELNRGGSQGASLNTIVHAYQSHPETAALVSRLRSMIGAAALNRFNQLLTVLTDRVAVALWLPSNGNFSAQPGLAVIAQLKPSSYQNGGNPLTGLATFSQPSTYQGATVYRVTFTGGGNGYGAVIQGDGVLTPDMASMKKVIDTAEFRAPSLAMAASYVTATSLFPAARLLTIYASAHLSDLALQGAQGVTNGAVPSIPSRFRRPYAVAMVAYPDGLSLLSSALPAAGPYATTPNNGAGAVGSSAILYLSIENLAAVIRATGLLSSGVLAQAQVSTGIDIARDVLPLISREVVVDINDETSPLVQNVAGALTGGASAPELPGSLEVATEVDSPAAALQSMRRIAAAILRLTGRGSSGVAPVQAIPLPDGSTGYGLTALPGVAYTVRGRFLILSTNLSGDIRAAQQQPLAADPDYAAALARVGGSGPLTSVSYLNVTRLIALINKYIAFAQDQGASIATTTVQQAEALFVPIRNLTLATRNVGAHDTQFLAFITIK